jgi:choline trimethylamine-lyase
MATVARRDAEGHAPKVDAPRTRLVGLDSLEAQANPSPRVARLREQYLQHKPTLGFSRAVAMTEVFKETEGEAQIIRRAKGLKRACETQKTLIQDHELIIGNAGEKPREGVFAPETSAHWFSQEVDTIHTRPTDPIVVSDGEKKLFWEVIYPYWEGKTLLEHWLAQVPDELKAITYKSGIIECSSKNLTGAAEIIVGLGEVLLKEGWKGIREHARRKLADFPPTVDENIDKRNFLRSVIISCDGMSILATRYANAARQAAAVATSSTRAEELLHVAEVCDWVSENPPRTFHEALQLIWFAQIGLMLEVNGSAYSLGRIDQYLWPYLRSDLEAGSVTQEQAQELLECLWVKYSEMHLYFDEMGAKYNAGTQAFITATIGGVDRHGNDAVNPLSYMCLKATADVRLFQPNIAVRLHRNCPEEFLRKACSVIRLGTGIPNIFNDESGMKMLMVNGIPPEEARDWAVVGCVEPNLAGRTSLWSEHAQWAFASAIEFAMFDGVHQISGERLGLSTGDAATFGTFDEFNDAFKKQLAYQIYVTAATGLIAERLHRDLLPCPLCSSLMLDCVEQGKELTRGGARYPLGPGTLIVGLADAVNSLAAVKKLVFDDGRLSMTRLRGALETDFVGHEDVQAMCLNEVPKWGNDDDYVDSLAQDMLEFTVEELHKYQTLHGSHLIPGIISVSANVPQGLVVGALPSGRKLGRPLADGCSPSQGTDTRGPTATLRSIGKFPHYDCSLGTLLNMKFDPAVVAGDEGLERLDHFLRAFLDVPAHEVQFNVVDRDTLLDAKKHPERHRSLLVRVAGYSAFFVELDPATQDDIISRTWHTELN